MINIHIYYTNEIVLGRNSIINIRKRKIQVGGAVKTLTIPHEPVYLCRVIQINPLIVVAVPQALCVRMWLLSTPMTRYSGGSSAPGMHNFGYKYGNITHISSITLY